MVLAKMLRDAQPGERVWVNPRRQVKIISKQKTDTGYEVLVESLGEHHKYTLDSAGRVLGDMSALL